jgi:hypothetical protein
VHVVRDLGLVDVLDLLDRQPGLLLREHEPVAIVVMPRVLVVEVGVDATEWRIFGLVPVIDHQHLAVRILRRHDQDDEIIENLFDFGPLVRREPMGDLDDRLCVADLGRVNGAVEKVEGASLLRQTFRVRRRQAARIREPAVDLDQAVDPREVLGRADRREHIGIPHRRLSDLAEGDATGRVCEMLEVGDDLGIARQLAVGADGEAEELIGRLRAPALGVGAGGRRGGQARQDESRRQDSTH